MFTSETAREAREKASPRGKAKLPNEIKERLLECLAERDAVEDLISWIYEIKTTPEKVNAMIKVMGMILPRDNRIMTDDTNYHGGNPKEILLKRLVAAANAAKKEAGFPTENPVS
ncbi:MAG: hypothetical protein HOG34_01640 [Bacteroidetes bacterium]|jgi:hypothetical protein|nr:hypothetical protein [Bacteroidota bacterium]MBT4402016.1 hypothetical protein [Bacteroidota bacterium]